MVAAEAGLMDNNKYTGLAQQLMEASLSMRLGSSDALQLLQGGINIDMSTYQEGQKQRVLDEWWRRVCFWY
ncbi:hypothetical protein IPG36_04555 [bacterium]|nr:MAG: hypothetical protein IPG36_04555 [bacterium]